MQYPTFRIEMGRLALVYGEQPPERLLEYWEALKGMADIACTRACAAYKQQPGAIRFPYPADLYALAAETAAARGEARNRALPSGAYTEATRVARADAARYNALHPPDPATVAHWDAKFTAMLARRDAHEHPHAPPAPPTPVADTPADMPAAAGASRPMRPTRSEGEHG